MSTFVAGDLGSPWGSAGRSRLTQKLFSREAFQAVAANENVLLTRDGNAVVMQAGTITGVTVVNPIVAGAGESMTVDVQKSTNGGGSWSSILTAPVSIPAATAAKTATVGTLSGTPTVVVGDILRVVVGYTAGGTPTPLANTGVLVEIE